MTGYLLDDPRLMKNKKGEYEEDRKNKVDKIFSDVEKLSQDSSLSDRYNNNNIDLKNLKHAYTVDHSRSAIDQMQKWLPRSRPFPSSCLPPLLEVFVMVISFTLSMIEK